MIVNTFGRDKKKDILQNTGMPIWDLFLFLFLTEHKGLVVIPFFENKRQNGINHAMAVDFHVMGKFVQMCLNVIQIKIRVTLVRM